MICLIFTKLDIPFWIFSSFISGITLLLSLPFFFKNCKKSVTSLFFFYSCFYLVYYFSAMRQGLAMSIFLSYGLNYFLCKEYKKYVVIVIICTLIHASAISLLVIFVINRFHINKIFALCIIILGIILIPCSKLMMSFMPTFLQYRIIHYSESISSSYLGVFLRILVLLPIFLIIKRNKNLDNGMEIYIKYLLCGYVLYCCTSMSALISSRICSYYYPLECAFIANVILDKRYSRKCVANIYAMYVLIAYAIYVRDINGFISQGNYQNCSILTYPYLNISDDLNEVKKYRYNLGFGDDS